MNTVETQYQPGKGRPLLFCDSTMFKFVHEGGPPPWNSGLTWRDIVPLDRLSNKPSYEISSSDVVLTFFVDRVGFSKLGTFGRRIS